LIPILVKAIQDLSKELNELKNKWYASRINSFRHRYKYNKSI
jgi:hypothetical protein